MSPTVGGALTSAVARPERRMHAFRPDSIAFSALRKALCDDVVVKRLGQRSNDHEDAGDEAARRPTRTPSPNDSRVVVSSAILTRRGFSELQRLAGNTATRSLIERAPAEGMAAVVQRQAAKAADPSAPEEFWSGSVKGHLGEHPVTYHTINNFGDRQLWYRLRIHNTGYALLNLGTQYEYKSGGPQREWIAIAAQRGRTEKVTNGLPPHSSLRLRLFGERDHTQYNQSYIEGTLEVRRTSALRRRFG